MPVIFDKEKCPQNHHCPLIGTCPEQAIAQKNIHTLPSCDADLCVECNICVDCCPKEAVSIA